MKLIAIFGLLAALSIATPAPVGKNIQSLSVALGMSSIIRVANKLQRTPRKKCRPMSTKSPRLSTVASGRMFRGLCWMNVQRSSSHL
ncbi:uncharacterized protein BO80DRAFT_215844 [Aspergillus ibericus CBS 121593]|uniref:Uncharacterized protein n=1 Tax=Aspergillus ibericus CBS 121593 TaxID=1448316 RepID=A0A395GN36_9EURO|nr:hypothetical protein BO80DRAFT_215844 [Aspergillus ibericus CBS 121593]RAK96762.1 hypothetical protein BO80DRAFT_215844 [Aspergillus ibericus CBS 121593]